MHRLPATTSALRELVTSTSPVSQGKLPGGSGGKGLAMHATGTLPKSNKPRLLCRSLHFSRREGSRRVFQTLFPRSRGQCRTRLLSKVPKETRSPTPPCKQRTSRSLRPVKNSNLTLHIHEKKKKKEEVVKRPFQGIYIIFPPKGINIPVFQSSFNGT